LNGNRDQANETKKVLAKINDEAFIPMDDKNSLLVAINTLSKM
jgi:hypothetical protein